VQLTQYYRTFDLAWDYDPEDQDRFRRLLLIGLVTVVVLGLILPFIHLPKIQSTAQDAVPERLARLMEQEKPKPPPPPVALPKPKPEEKPTEQPKPLPDTRKKMEESAQMRAIKDQLADLRDKVDVTPLQAKNLTGAVGQDMKSDRSLIASKVGSGSSGMVVADSSRGFGSGAGSLNGHDTTTVSSGLANAIAKDRAERAGANGKGGRSREEIELVFDNNKGAIYALYTRALRDNPELMGKLVLEFTVTPAGDITECHVVSSELKDQDLERKIVARVKLFRFEARDVQSGTFTKEIEFFPAG
jgi:periplasmic protein TonB